MIEQKITLKNSNDFFFDLLLPSIFTIAETAIARVAKLVDALPSGGSVRKDVLVRIQSRALKESPYDSNNRGDFLILNN